ncbi:MAG: RNA polymerase sigma factor RpoD/SigA [Candidatus Andersenbacteria bacterium]|nr:RNA polymerase sigma factor RpoD/SigA [Candidatus Andersenbacteria bacterium]MBI3251154.1 RNA polymerase sigma factor RpoD/SigA [Candidatus Andersenbacteria bacterium]
MTLSVNKKAEAAKRAPRSVSGLTRYLQDIGKVPLLTGPEEQALARRIRKGDQKARQHMMLANLRLVVNIAKQYVPGGDPDLLMDLVQDGNIGLMRAIDRFDPKFKTRFSTYGVYWIRQAILRALKSRRLVRLPENVQDRILEMQRTRQRLYQMLGRSPAPEELAREMSASVKEVRRLEEVNADVVSLEKAVRGRDDEEDTRLGDLLEDQDALSPTDTAQVEFVRRKVQEAVATLPARERAIIEQRFGLTTGVPKTLEEIGQEFQISRERVRQLQNVALSRLKQRKNVQNVR